MKHTPGPWEADPDGYIVRDSEYNAVCILFNKVEDSLPNAEANSKLIESAPELYELAQKIATGSFNRIQVKNKARTLIEKVER